jgi:hypothetical protein
MEMVKKNLVSIICGVIALIAVIAIFYPIDGMYADLNRQASQSAILDSSIKTLLTKERHKPILPDLKDLQSSETPQAPKLDAFPTRNVIDMWKAVTEQIKAESSKMYEAAVKLNTHEPLVPGALPDAPSVAAISFRDAYQRAMKQTLQDRVNNIAFTTLKGGVPPTDPEIQTRRREVEKQMRDRTPLDASNQPINAPIFLEKLKTTLLQVPDQMTLERSKSIKVYIDPNALSPHMPVMQLQFSRAPDARDIFVAQIGYWVQKDILDALATLNKDASDVSTAPVKHLIKIGFTDPTFRQFTTVTPTQPGATGTTSEDPAAPQTPNYAQSPTGRVTNGIYDVVRFNLKINVDAASVPAILQELSRNKFITVTSCNLQAVDNGQFQARRYYFGDKPVVQLDIQGEQLFMRQWTKPLMPTAVKTALAIPTTPPAAK